MAPNDSQPSDASVADTFSLDGATTSFGTVPADLEHICPRCQLEVTERFYGPCTNCRAELRASQGNEQVERDAVEYEPKMNVTPNAVALKDD